MSETPAASEETDRYVVGDAFSDHGLPIGARVSPCPPPPWATSSGWYTQGLEGDEVAIDPRDLATPADFFANLTYNGSRPGREGPYDGYVVPPAPRATGSGPDKGDAVEDYGTVEQRPYVGDTDLIVVSCRHCEYARVFKGATIRGGEKALAEHYAAKHGVVPPGGTDA